MKVASTSTTLSLGLLTMTNLTYAAPAPKKVSSGRIGRVGSGIGGAFKSAGGNIIQDAAGQATHGFINSVSNGNPIADAAGNFIEGVIEGNPIGGIINAATGGKAAPVQIQVPVPASAPAATAAVPPAPGTPVPAPPPPAQAPAPAPPAPAPPANKTPLDNLGEVVQGFTQPFEDIGNALGHLFGRR